MVSAIQTVKTASTAKNVRSIRESIVFFFHASINTAVQT